MAGESNYGSPSNGTSPVLLMAPVLFQPVVQSDRFVLEGFAEAKKKYHDLQFEHTMNTCKHSAKCPDSLHVLWQIAEFHGSPHAGEVSALGQEVPPGSQRG